MSCTTIIICVKKYRTKLEIIISLKTAVEMTHSRSNGIVLDIVSPFVSRLSFIVEYNDFKLS